MSIYNSFQLGCDPEFFVTGPDGTPVTAAGLIPGDKELPHPVTGGAIQVDGMAVEFNTNPVPLNNREAFHTNFVEVVSALKKALPKGHDLLIQPSIVFDAEYYATVVPDSAKKLGCDPDYNAYTGEKNVPPSSDSPARGAAGHIHIGWGKDIPALHDEHMALCREFVKCLDFWVGMGLTIFETDTERRKMYGAAGAFRPKSYGVEYRVPSNAWCTNKARRDFMITLVQYAVQDMARPNPYYADVMKGKGRTLSGLAGSDIVRIINNSDRTAALQHLQNYVILPSSMYTKLLAGVK